MEPEGPCYIPLEAGNTDAHIPWVTQFLEQRGEDSNQCPGSDDTPSGGEETLKGRHIILLSF
jgi:hypothetical protein